MTDEELAAHIGTENDDTTAIARLWEQVKPYFICRASRYISKFSLKCADAGVTIEDIVQESYFAMLEGIKAYNSRPEKHKDLAFLAFCNFPFKNRVAEMLGLRGHSDPLNSGVYSLDYPVEGTEKGLTYADILADEEAEEPFRKIEDRSYRKCAMRCIEKLLKDENPDEYKVIKLHYFYDEAFSDIARELGVSAERARQIEKSALKHLRDNRELKELAGYNEYRRVSIEDYKRNGSIEEQIVERKLLDEWRYSICDEILKNRKG